MRLPAFLTLTLTGLCVRLAEAAQATQVRQQLSTVTLESEGICRINNGDPITCTVRQTDVGCEVVNEDGLVVFSFTNLSCTCASGDRSGTMTSILKGGEGVLEVEAPNLVHPCQAQQEPLVRQEETLLPTMKAPQNKGSSEDEERHADSDGTHTLEQVQRTGRSDLEAGDGHSSESQEKENDPSEVTKDGERQQEADNTDQRQRSHSKFKFAKSPEREEKEREEAMVFSLGSTDREDKHIGHSEDENASEEAAHKGGEEGEDGDGDGDEDGDDYDDYGDDYEDDDEDRDGDDYYEDDDEDGNDYEDGDGDKEHDSRDKPKEKGDKESEGREKELATEEDTGRDEKGSDKAKGQDGDEQSHTLIHTKDPEPQLQRQLPDQSHGAAPKNDDVQEDPDRLTTPQKPTTSDNVPKAKAPIGKGDIQVLSDDDSEEGDGPEVPSKDTAVEESHQKQAKLVNRLANFSDVRINIGSGATRKGEKTITFPAREITFKNAMLTVPVSLLDSQDNETGSITISLKDPEEVMILHEINAARYTITTSRE